MTQLPPIIASFGNAYRVAVKLADATDTDQRVLSTGDPARPFVVDHSYNDGLACVAFITAGM